MPMDDLEWMTAGDLPREDCSPGQNLYQVSCRRGGGEQLYCLAANRKVVTNCLKDRRQYRGALRTNGTTVHWPFRVVRVCSRSQDEHGQPAAMNESACNRCPGLRDAKRDEREANLLGVGCGQDL